MAPDRSRQVPFLIGCAEAVGGYRDSAARLPGAEEEGRRTEDQKSAYHSWRPSSSAPTARLHTSLGKRAGRCPRYQIEKETEGCFLLIYRGVSEFRYDFNCAV